jgi:hypothetical protein
MWMASRAWLEDPAGAALPDDDALQADACGPGYRYDSNTRLAIEKKEDMRRRGVQLTFATGLPPHNDFRGWASNRQPLTKGRETGPSDFQLWPAAPQSSTGATPSNSTGGDPWANGTGGRDEAQIDEFSAEGRGAGRRGGSPEPEPGQYLRLDTARARAAKAVRSVQELDPHWRPRPSFSNIDNMESRIRLEQAILAEAQARLGELRGGAAPTSFLLPYGFRTPDEFTAFRQMMHGGLRDMQYAGVQVFLRGSALDGRNSRTGEFFDVGRRSDFDIALASPVLFRRAAEIGVGLRGGGTRTDPLTRDQLRELGLLDLANLATRQVDRPVTFMLYNSSGAVRQRGPSLPILGK